MLHVIIGNMLWLLSRPDKKHVLSVRYIKVRQNLFNSCLYTSYFIGMHIRHVLSFSFIGYNGRVKMVLDDSTTFTTPLLIGNSSFTKKNQSTLFNGIR